MIERSTKREFTTHLNTMNRFFFPLKNYLYTKTKLRYLIPVLAIFIFTSCSQGNGGVSQSYDMPPGAPIPPEKYCFEEKANGINSTKLELNVVGDTAYGIVNYDKAANLPTGNFKGVLYGTTLIVNYKFKTDTGLVTQEQEWNIVDDSLSLVIQRKTGNSTTDSGALTQVYYSGSLHKVPCK